MEKIAGKKLPTVEQVETMIAEYGKTSIEDLADRFSLDTAVVKAALDCLRQLRRMPEGAAVPTMTCFRDDSLESIVRCAGSKYGYV